MNIFKNPNGFKFYFDWASRSYYGYEKGGSTVPLQSVTRVIYDIFPEFDKDGEILKRTAAKRNMTEEALRKEWDENRRVSREAGIKVHNLCELGLKGELTADELTGTDNVSLTVRNAKKVIDYIFNKCSEIEIEKTIGDYNAMIAGRVDMMFRSRKDGELWLCDWKTSKNISKENTFNEFANAPFNYIPATNFWKFSLQLNMFEYILRAGGYVGKDERVNKCIIKVTKDGYENIRVKDLDDEINDIIEKKVMTKVNHGIFSDINDEFQ